MEDKERQQSWISELERAAFLRGPAQQANQLIQDARESFLPPDSGQVVFSFEIWIPPESPIEWVLEKSLPALVYHCESRRAQLPECVGVFVSCFHETRLFCVSAAKFVAYLGEALSLSSEELVRRYGTGESRQAMRGAEPTRADPESLGEAGRGHRGGPLLLGSE